MAQKVITEIVSELSIWRKNETTQNYFKEPATKQNIAEFEEANDIQLPDAYKEWLLFSD